VNLEEPEGSLNAVSCTSATFCLAVGSDTDESGHGVAMAEQWNGTAWSIVNIPTPHGGYLTVLSGVSCPTSTECIAVGSYNVASTGQFAFAEIWKAGAWTIENVPVPTSEREQAALSGVSCVSSDSCLAVGSTGGTPLADSWNGTAWSLTATIAPAETGADLLTGVSCRTRTVDLSCAAVGEYQNDDGDDVPMAQTWNGATWSLDSVPLPTNGIRGQLEGVSCTSISDCTAVGTVSGQGWTAPLGETMTGSEWNAQTLPVPSEASGALLDAVSCLSASVCAAVGNDDITVANSADAEATLAEVWNGSVWSIEDTPNPDSTVNTLGGVACVSRSSCVAVGQTINGAGTYLSLAISRSDASWSLQHTPNRLGFNETFLEGVSCTSSAFCMAVGYSLLPDNDGFVVTDTYSVAFTELWNGTTWTYESVPDPNGSTRSRLNAISCVSSTSCTAVGLTGTSETPQSLIEIWDGTRWSIQTNSGSVDLNAVSCLGTHCMAVGGDVADRWNGATWKVETVPVPSGGAGEYTDLFGVSCPSKSLCIAVGSDEFASVAEDWNGSAWTLQQTPTLSTASGANWAFSGVSCVSADVCTAVGTQFLPVQNSPYNYATLAEMWNGVSWTVESTPTETNATYLNGVSCTAQASCTAVGSYETGYGNPVFAEVWDGTMWTIQDLPSPSASVGALDYLNDVACTAKTVCTAVGSTQSSALVDAE
jgi:hypothetical protein